MTNQIISAIATGTAAILGWLGDVVVLLSPFGTDSRLHWTGLIAFVALGLGVFLYERRQGGGRGGGRGAGVTGPIAFLFPPKLYRSASSWVDVKVYIAGRLVKPLIAGILLPLGALVTAAIAALVAPLASASQTAGEAGGPGMASVIAATAIAALLGDLSYYVTHRASHESQWLWPFHKLHHSAQVLTPITAKRNHPVFDLALGLVRIITVAPVSGIVFGLFAVTGFATIFGLTILIAMMNVMGGALRHSHIWLGYGPVFSRIFISPAQHQIHHSMAVEHHDRNYGLTLAIWDWMFGTLYVPTRREHLLFGVADANGTALPQAHPTLKDAYLVPFREIAETARKGRPRSAPAAPAAPVAQDPR